MILDILTFILIFEVYNVCHNLVELNLTASLLNSRIVFFWHFFNFHQRYTIFLVRDWYRSIMLCLCILFNIMYSRIKSLNLLLDNMRIALYTFIFFILILNGITLNSYGAIASRRIIWVFYLRHEVINRTVSLKFYLLVMFAFFVFRVTIARKLRKLWIIVGTSMRWIWNLRIVLIFGWHFNLINDIVFLVKK